MLIILLLLLLLLSFENRMKFTNLAVIVTLLGLVPSPVFGKHVKSKSSKSKTERSTEPPTEGPTTVAPTGRVSTETYLRTDWYNAVDNIGYEKEISNSGLIAAYTGLHDFGFSQGEIERLGITLCENSKACTAVTIRTYFSFEDNFQNQNREDYLIELWNPSYGPLVATNDEMKAFAVIADNGKFFNLKFQVMFMKKDKPAIPLIQVCNIPESKYVEQGIGFLVYKILDENGFSPNDVYKSEDCQTLLTGDYVKYFQPTIDCLSNGGTTAAEIRPCFNCFKKNIVGFCDYHLQKDCSDNGTIGLFATNGTCDAACDTKCTKEIQISSNCAGAAPFELEATFNTTDGTDSCLAKGGRDSRGIQEIWRLFCF